jgi:glucose-1-phosphate adenylyltransferase
VPLREVHRFGILKQAPDGALTAFVEKPQTEACLSDLEYPDDPARPFLASMGIYAFRTEALMALLDSEHVDFGSDVLPAALPAYRVLGYRFEGYWEDIGTIRSFYEANLALAQADPPFAFHHPDRPIYTRPRFLPGSRLDDVRLDRVLLADGCLIEQAQISNALIGNRSVIERDVTLRDTIVMGADAYEPKPARERRAGLPLGIGRGSSIQGAIIDKNARIGRDVRLGPFPPGTDFDDDNCIVRDGIVVVPKNAIIAPETVIAPQ